MSENLKPLNITKEHFVESIKAIQEQMSVDIETTSALNVAFPQSNIMPYNHVALYKALINLLKTLTFDKQESELSWIEYYIYDCRFGTNPLAVNIFGEEYILDSSENLYEILEKLANED